MVHTVCVYEHRKMPAFSETELGIDAGLEVSNS